MQKWLCTVCGYIHEGEEPPEKCPVCGVPANRFIMYRELPSELEASLRRAFAGESKAHVRNLAFAKKAEVEGYSQIAHLFKAVADAERVHAAAYLKYLEGVIGSTEENLERAFENELKAQGEIYPELITQANQLGREDVAQLFSQARDVEDLHGKLYKEAMTSMLDDGKTEYFVCQVCGYISTAEAPDTCPICQAGSKSFKKIQ